MLSSLQVLSQVIQDLAKHPDAAVALRQELEESQASVSFEALDRLPLLDSFFKESMRTNCFDSCKLLHMNMSALLALAFYRCIAH